MIGIFIPVSTPGWYAARRWGAKTIGIFIPVSTRDDMRHLDEARKQSIFRNFTLSPEEMQVVNALF